MKTLIRDLARLLAIPTFSLLGATVVLADAGIRILEWQELAPADWEAPLIAPAYDGSSKQLVDEKSVVADLDGLQVKLAGFMRPIVFSDRTVSEFLLVPFLPHHVTQHAHIEPNQMIYIVLEQPIDIDNPFKPLWVTGTLHLQTVLTDEGPAGYSLSGAGIQAYDYPQN